ncbi:EF-hand domain-containing protein [Hydrocarboniphaga sp.]|uniref:EF-hand domain-containing protein n=1 Tax=Hydrocarboniphaga sp. TaxID=2033016 RepID=UPI003D102E21
MRYLIILTMSGCCVLASGAAVAQDRERGQQAMQELNERFDAADTDHNGKLGKKEAKAGMPRVSEHFDQLDADKDGYLTKGEIVGAMIDMKDQREHH